MHAVICWTPGPHASPMLLYAYSVEVHDGMVWTRVPRQPGVAGGCDAVIPLSQVRFVVTSTESKDSAMTVDRGFLKLADESGGGGA